MFVRPLSVLALAAALGGPLAPGAAAQPRGLVDAPGISRNYAAPLVAEGASLWGTPLLSVTRDGGQTWQQAALDSLRVGRYRVRTLDVEGPVVWAGLYTFVDDGTSDLDRLRDAGFAVSTDDGATFRLLGPILDRSADTTIAYGANRLSARIVASTETDAGYARAYDLDYDAPTGTTWVAGGYLGLRRTANGGQTWTRVVLPPDFLETITPSGTYTFKVGPKTTRFPGGSFNHVVVSTLVDARGTVWAGSIRGLNRSTDGGASWTRLQPTGAAASLPSLYAADLFEQYPGEAAKSAVWAITYQNADVADTGRDGLSVTTDRGETWRRALVDETVYDVAFRGATVYAATNRGLLVSPNDGQTWTRLRDVCDPAEPPAACVTDRPVVAVAVTSDGTLWAGTTQGLYRSTDGGASWTVNRALASLTTRTATDERTVETFAYPNPFSPGSDRVVRLRFDARGGGAYRVRVFDYAMRLVRTLEDAASADTREVLWDGTDASGLRVPNGPYFYTAEGDGRTLRGKILLVD